MARITNNIFTEREKEVAKQKKIADMETATANAIVKSITDKYGFKNEHFCNGRVNGFKFQFGKYEIDIILPDSLAMKWKEVLPNVLAFVYGKPSFSGLRSYLVKNKFRFICSFQKKGIKHQYALYMNDNTEICEGVYPSSIRGSISIPDGVTSIGERAFSVFWSLKSINIPDSVTSIGDSAFFYCASLEWIRIPDGVTEICDSAFTNCVSLKLVSIPDGVTKIGKWAFNNCESLEVIRMPDGIISIGNYSFTGCESLKSIIIPNSVTSIGVGAFRECKMLESVSIPDGVTEINFNAFEACRSLESINIPNSVMVICERAFYGCGLKSIKLPNGLKSIEPEAFRFCSLLKTITYNGTRKQWWDIYKDEMWHKDIPAKVVHCTDGDVEIYKYFSDS